MIGYIVDQIIFGRLTYDYVVARRPDLKEAIDKYIKDNEIVI